MTDSEEEYEVDEYHRVGFAAEVACVLAIGCVAGLKGLSRMRRGVCFNVETLKLLKDLRSVMIRVEPPIKDPPRKGRPPY